MVEWIVAFVIGLVFLGSCSLVGILSVLTDISGHLRKIAAMRESEIGITVPGNRNVTVNLPDETITTEGCTHGQATP